MCLNSELENKLDQLIGQSNDENTTVIRVKKDNGLMEKTTSKVILIEDNRQVLTD